MLLKSEIVRKNGTRHIVGADYRKPSAVYHFTGPVDGPHLCDVDDKVVMHQLLSMAPMAFSIADEADIAVWGGKAPAKPKPAPQPAPEGAAQVATAIAEDEVKQANSAARKAYIAHFGKNPSPKWKADQMLAKIAEDKAEDDGPDEDEGSDADDTSAPAAD